MTLCNVNNDHYELKRRVFVEVRQMKLSAGNMYVRYDDTEEHVQPMALNGEITAVAKDQGSQDEDSQSTLLF